MVTGESQQPKSSMAETHVRSDGQIPSELANARQTVARLFPKIVVVGLLIIGAYPIAQILSLSLISDVVTKIAVSTVLQIGLAILFGAACLVLGIMMTWLGITAAYEISASGERGGVKVAVSLASVSPGLLFAIIGAILIGFANYKPVGYQEQGSRIAAQPEPQQSSTSPMARPKPPRQFYEEVMYNENRGEWIYEWSFRPNPNESTYRHQQVIVREQDAQFAYYFNPVTRIFWGRYDYRRSGYSMLPDDKKVQGLDDLRFGAFPSPGEMPELPWIN